MTNNVVKTDKYRTKEGNQADKRLAGFNDPSADFLHDAQMSGPFFGPNLGRVIKFGCSFDQRRHVALGADNLSSAVADCPVDHPCPDRIHLFDAAEVEDERIRLP